MRRGVLASTRFRLSCWLATALAVVAGLGAVAPAAWAQSLGLVPAEVDYAFKPGQPFEFELASTNRSPAPVYMRVSVTDLWYNDKNEKVFGPPGSSPRSAANWIEFVPRQIEVPPQGTGKVKVLVTPPLSAVGGYYAVVFLESKPELVPGAGKDGKGVYTNLRLGCLVLLSAARTQIYTAEVSDAHVTPPSGTQALKVDYVLLNKGNTHLFPRPAVAIFKSGKDLVGKAEGDTKRFLPGQKDSMSVSWPGALPPGSYMAVLAIQYGEDKVYTQDLPFTVGSTP
ncbi:MAG TPA: hypothetical protein VMO17_17425 [Terriglobia bacterium]|nr:hypothetical protein [Terriglobia bacterium]